MSETFDTPIWHSGKTLRRGYTTGLYTTATAKVTTLMVLRQHLTHQVSIMTPSRVTLCLNMESPHIEGQQAITAIRKNDGDDVDATHGMLVFARVALDDGGVIALQGGEGVGTVTRKGTDLPVGSSTTNRIPHQTAESAVREAIGPSRGTQIKIFTLEGKERAQGTYNSRLGILDGISTIGTTDIVTPMSEESWRRSLSLGLEIKRTAGLERAVLVPGNHGGCFVREQTSIGTQVVITTNNLVGYMIEEAVRLGFQQIVLVRYLGEFVKIATGTFHTHSRAADARVETLVAHPVLLDAPLELLTLVGGYDTTEATIKHIDAHGFQHIYDHLTQRICIHVLQALRFAKNPPIYDAIMFSFDNQVPGSSRPVTEVAGEIQC